MLPTFRSDGDVVIVRKIPQNSYEVGDVVICESISNPNKTVCKRLAALPGDVIPLETQFGLFKYQIPIDHVWILGDNPPNSHDSRHYGPVPISHLKGRVVCKVRLLEFPSFIQEVRRVKPVFKDYP
jgi:signal peptidase I